MVTVEGVGSITAMTSFSSDITYFKYYQMLRLEKACGFVKGHFETHNQSKPYFSSSSSCGSANVGCAALSL
jgi:hypothetical protein